MRIGIDYVKEGAVLASNVYDKINYGIALVPAGTIITETILNKLKSRDIEELDINLTPDEELELTLKLNGVSSIKQSVLLESRKAVLGMHVPKEEIPVKIKDIIKNAEDIVREVKKSSLSYKLADYKDRAEASEHAVRVAVFATVLANEYNKTVDDVLASINLEDIATAALLHDLGANCEDDEIRKSIGVLPQFGNSLRGLSDEKAQQLIETYESEYIPFYSYCLVKDDRSISPVAKNMILLSRENEKLGGPLKALISASPKHSGAQHVIAAKIINVCSFFDEYLKETIQNSRTLENVKEALVNLVMTEQFTPELINLFMASIPLYPVKTVVKIAGSRQKNGSYEPFESLAIVTANYDDAQSYHSPRVVDVKTREEFELREEPFMVIVNVVENNENKFSELYDRKIEGEAFVPKGR